MSGLEQILHAYDTMTRSITCFQFARVSFFCLALTVPLLAQAELCAPVFRISDCAGHLEAELLRSHPKLFTRQVGTLKVHLLNGRVREFKDAPQNETEDNIEKHVAYSLVQFFPEIGYALIDGVYWEGGTYYLVDIKTGATTNVGGEVALSPNKRRFAVWNVDIEAEYTANVLAVYRVTADGLINEFLASPDNWGPNDVVWEGNDIIRFSRNYWGASDIEKKTQRLRLAIQRPEAVWQIE